LHNINDKKIMKKFNLTIIASILLINPLFGQTNEHTDKLKEFLDQEKYEAIIKYKRNKTDIFDAEALYIKAMAYYFTEDDKYALKYFDLAIDKGPVDDNMYFYKGITLFYLKKFNKSLESFNKAIDIDPYISDYYAMKGEVFMQLNKLDSALYFMQKATEFDECNVRVYLTLGEIYIHKEEYEKSLNAFRKAIKELERNTESHKNCKYNIGLTQQLAGKYQDAEKTFRDHLSLYPKDYYVTAKLIQVKHTLKKFDESKELKDILYKAHDKNKLPKDMKVMYCFEQFKWNKKTVFAFEKFDENESDAVICKHKFLIPNENGDVKYKIQTEPDTVNGKKIYLLKLIKNDTLYTFRNYTYKDTPDYSELKNAVLDILNNKLKPSNVLGGYAEYTAKIRAEKNDFSKLDNDGSSFEKAVVAKSITFEYDWLKKYYPGYSFIQQSLQFHNDKPYDILKIKTIDGTTIDVYFDISKFFGKGF